MRVIDLIPPDLAARRESRRLIRQWALRVGIAAALGAALYASLDLAVTRRNSELSGLTGRYDVMRHGLDRADALFAERDRIERRYEAISLVGADHKVAAIIAVLGAALTPDSHLGYLEINRCSLPDHDPAAQGGQGCRAYLKMRGWAPGNREVGEIIRHLITADGFSEVDLIWTRDVSGSGPATRVEFEIECSVDRRAGPPAPRDGGTDNGKT